MIQITSRPQEKESARILTKAEIFIDLAKPNSHGFSRKVPIEELESAGLGFGNGGSWCRDDGALAKKYNVERIKSKNRIVAVKLNGFNKNPISKPVPAKFKALIASRRCVVLNTSNPECDHKDGRRDDPRLNDPNRVVMDDFQPLSKAANNAKRQHCKECRDTNKRFDARVLGYKAAHWEGDEFYKGSCIGCYWHNPHEFNRQLSKQFKIEDP